jgi:hypothetical protein
MADETADLTRPYLLASQAQKHVTENESLAWLNGLVQLAVQNRTITAQTGAPDEGRPYVLLQGAALAGKSALMITLFYDGIWEFIAPKPGFLAFCAAEGALLFFDGANWRFVATLVDAILNAEIFALGGETDAATPYYAWLGKTLFTAKLAADGGDGDLRVILSKEAAGDSGSLLFQTGFSGRAEIGVTGDVDLHVKVSSDGTAWIEALKIAHDSGIAALSAEGRRPCEPRCRADGGLSQPAHHWRLPDQSVGLRGMRPGGGRIWRRPLESGRGRCGRREPEVA